MIHVCVSSVNARLNKTDKEEAVKKRVRGKKRREEEKKTVLVITEHD